MATKQRVFVVGVGMTKFEKAGQGQDYPEMGKLACERALHDAKISYKDVKTVIAGYNYGDPTCGKSIFVACLLINLTSEMKTYLQPNL
jgi:acetyl-CoA acetyltransferase